MVDRIKNTNPWLDRNEEGEDWVSRQDRNSSSSSRSSTSSSSSSSTMPALSCTNLTSNQVAAGASSITSASISPSANKLLICSVGNTYSGGSPNVPTVSGCNGTWTQIGTCLCADGLRRLTVFRAVISSPTSGAVTADLGGQASSGVVSISIEEFTNADTSGTNGSGAIVQTASGNLPNGTTTGITITLAAFDDINNATFGALRISMTPTINVGSGFTQLGSQTQFNTEYKNTNDTSVDWTWASTSLACQAYAIEIRSLIQS